MSKLKVLRLVPVLLVLAPAVAFGQPTNLTGAVSGNTVTLTWSGGSGSYVVEASIVSNGPIIATLPVSGTTLVVPAVPPGTYFVRVRDAATNARSNETSVTVGGTGCPAPPLPPNVIVRSVGFNVTVSWSPSGGCAPSSYTLFAGSAPGLSNVAVANTGGALGLSAVAPGGVYYVRVVGTNAFGSAVSQEMVIRVAANAQTDTVSATGAVAFDVVITQSGPYQGMLVWDDPTVDLDLYLTSAGCPYPPSGCLLAISDAATGTTEQVSRSVTAGDTYRIWVDNFSGKAASFTIFSTIGGVAATSASQAAAGEASASDAAGAPQITKAKP
jgi:hypothetical protein